MRRPIPVFIFAGLFLFGTGRACHAEDKPKWKKVWLATAAALVATNAIDIHSSRGLSETNPLLRDSYGRFSPQKGLLIKSAASGGLLLIEVLFLKKMPDHNLHQPFAITNSIAAGVVVATAFRNYTISRTPPPRYLSPTPQRTLQ